MTARRNSGKWSSGGKPPPRKPTPREIAIGNRFLRPRMTPRRRPQPKPGEPQLGV